MFSKAGIVIGILAVTSGSWANVMDSFDTDTSANYSTIDPFGPGASSVFSIDTVIGAARFDYPEAGNNPKVLMHSSEIVAAGKSVQVHIDLGSESFVNPWDDAREVSLLAMTTLPSWTGWTWPSTYSPCLGVGYKMAVNNCTGINLIKFDGTNAGAVIATSGPLGTDYWLQMTRNSASSFTFSTSTDGINWNTLFTDNAGPDIQYAGFSAYSPGFAYPGLLTPPMTVAVKDFNIVPEPISLALLAAGSLIAVRRRNG